MYCVRTLIATTTYLGRNAWCRCRNRAVGRGAGAGAAGDAAAA